MRKMIANKAWTRKKARRFGMQIPDATIAFEGPDNFTRAGF